LLSYGVNVYRIIDIHEPIEFSKDHRPIGPDQAFCAT
jgi:hypothetical protein